MISALRLVTPPALEPVDPDTAIAHCRIDADDGGRLLLDSYIVSARAWVETFLGRVLITQTLDWSVGEAQPAPGPNTALVPLTSPATMLAPGSLLAPPLGFPWPPRRPLELPRSPVQSVVSVTLGGLDIDPVALDASQYAVDLATDPARLLLQPGAAPRSWERVTVRFKAGYGDQPAAVPAPIRHAILLLTAFLWEHRGDAGGDMPKAAEMLLSPYRLVTFGG